MNGQQHGDMSRQNSGTPQKFTHDLQWAKHPHEHMKNTPFISII
ncbi:hypothetical protein GCM10007199_34240 [Fictibacillus barbaricus]|nr:hypothetical protein GCM10007199_34240 [Fictibacillus barbaricus]